MQKRHNHRKCKQKVLLVCNYPLPRNSHRAAVAYCYWKALSADLGKSFKVVFIIVQLLPSCIYFFVLFKKESA